MKYGDVTYSEYCAGINALKWSLVQARSKVVNLDLQLHYAQNEVNKIVDDLKKILEATS